MNKAHRVEIVVGREVSFVGAVHVTPGWSR
jgi:hypothetical protein